MALDTNEPIPGAAEDDTAALPTFEQFALSAREIAALKARDITTPTPIQAGAIPPLFAGPDMVRQSRPGAGKTLHFDLTLIQRLDTRVRADQARIMIPPRDERAK